MPAPIFSLATTGTDPKATTAKFLEDAINVALGSIYDSAVVAQSGTPEEIITAFEDVRDGALAAQAGAEAARDSVANVYLSFTISSAPQYANVAAGIAAVSDGAYFAITPSAGSLFVAGYRRNGVSADFQGWAPVGLNGSNTLTAIQTLRSRVGRPTHEWDFRFSLDGMKIPNLGTAKVLQDDPDNGLLAASGVAIDADGSSTGVRFVWPDGVPNVLGHDECVQLDFASTSDELFIAQRTDFASMPDTDITVVADIRMASGSQPIIVGSSSAGAGEKTEVTLTTTLQRVTVDMAEWGSSKAYDLTVRPGAAATFPHSVIVERVQVYPKGAGIPSIEEWRANRLAGHAYAAPLAFSGALGITEGYFEPSETARVMNVDLTGEPITDLHMSFYMKVDDVADVASGQYAMGFQMDEKPGENFVTQGSVQFGATGNLEYSARMYAYAGDNNTYLQEISDQILPGYGWARVDVQLSGVGTEARMRPGDAVATDKRYEIYINGVEHTDVATDGMNAEMTPRLFNIGGVRSNIPDSVVALASAFPGKIALPRLNINADRADSEAIMVEMLDDLAQGRAQIDKPLLHVLTEGDSTSRFSGTPPHWYAREMAGPKRMFTNVSQGGRYFSDNILTNNNGNCFNGENVIGFRRNVLNKSVRDLDCPLTILMYLGGENNDTQLSPPADAQEDIKAIFMADVEAARAFNPTASVVPVLQTVRPSGSGGPTGSSYLRRDAYNEYLRGLFTVATANPYLFKSSDVSATGFEYLIDLDAWPPASDTETFADWFDCLDDSIANGGNTVISADEQHWAGTTGGKKCAEQVYSPAITIIAADYGQTL